MEGPTPVSALIHAATMVTVRVWRLLKINWIFNMIPNVWQIVLWLGSLTAFLAASTANAQSDIKKIIAYSTCSQLRYMIVAIRISQQSIGFYHLLNHAYYKSLLFLSAGLLIHTWFNEQDIRKFRKFNKK